MTYPEDCTNPAQPCRLHDAREEWRIEVGKQWTIHAGWLVGALFIVGFVSLWFN